MTDPVARDVELRLTDPAWLAHVANLAPGDGTSPALASARAVRAERIGAGYGLSGVVHRLHLTGDDGPLGTIVAKLEDATHTRRAVTAHRHLHRALGRSMTRMLGSWIDDTVGVLLLEDLVDATQGNDLLGGDLRTTEALVRVVAGVHAVDPTADDTVERYERRPGDRDRWEQRVTVALDRFWADRPHTHDRIRALLDRAIGAEDELAMSRYRWAHVDPHLDNVMRRPDGAVVLIDWSNAVLGPIELDLAALLTTSALRRRAPLRPDDVFTIYADERRRLDRPMAIDDVRRAGRLGVEAHLPGVVRWLGAPAGDDDPPRRQALARAGAVRIDRAIAWLDDH